MRRTKFPWRGRPSSPEARTPCVMDPSSQPSRLRRSLLALAVLAMAGLPLLGACQGMPKAELRAALEALPKNQPAAAHGLQRTPLTRGPAPAVLHLSTTPTAPIEAGLPVVLIHGTPATLFCWTEVIFGAGGEPGLSRAREVHALEIPGHGCAEEGTPLSGFQDAADHIVSSLEALGLQRVHLVGHSYGGEFALRAALDAPERIASLTLIDSAGLPRAEGGWLPEEVEMREHPLANWGWLLNSPERITTALAPHFRELPPDRVDEFVLVCSNRRNWEAMIALVRDENGDRASELANLTAPTLLLWGQDDFAYTPEREGAAFLEALPNATLEVLPGSGHYPIEDQPTAVTRLLEAHFEAVERQARESSPAAR